MSDARSTCRSTRPILYSFRRCPYAIRARLALKISGLNIELREISLKNKAEAFLQASPKATVPVLVLANGEVIDESLDIMHWALQQNDPEDWLYENRLADSAETALIHENDHDFKINLDHYKYFDRFPEHTQLEYRQQGEIFLHKLDQRLQTQAYLSGHKKGLSDVAIFPFIRQFAHVDIQWFRQSRYVALCHWLDGWLESPLFSSVMQKHKDWQPGAASQLL